MTTYTVTHYDGDGFTETFEADSWAEAKAEARERLTACAERVERTVWYRGRLEDDESYEDIRVAHHPEEPRCLGGSRGHDWDRPHSILGGLRENPGVRGNGGGVVVRSVCLDCGTLRVEDTWAQDPETGEQGLLAIRYDEGHYAPEVEALREAAE